MMIYLVIAEHARYSEYRWWIVRAHETREAAEDHLERANRQARLAVFIVKSAYSSSIAYDDLHLTDYEGDGGLLLQSDYDPDPDAPDWSGRHRCHETCCNSWSWGTPAYRVLEVELGL